MPRKFVSITEDEFTDKLSAFSENHDNRYLISELTPQVEKDLSKVDFDCENVYEGGKFDGMQLGYQTLDNGMPMFGVMAGGDWEWPIFFCIYWDGKNFRGYIPKDGNPWNPINKMPYGNDEVADAQMFERLYPDEYKNMEIEAKEAGNDYWKYNLGDTLVSREKSPDKIIEDIKSRICEKV